MSALVVADTDSASGHLKWARWRRPDFTVPWLGWMGPVGPLAELERWARPNLMGSLAPHMPWPVISRGMPYAMAELRSRLRRLAEAERIELWAPEDAAGAFARALVAAATEAELRVPEGLPRSLGEEEVGSVDLQNLGWRTISAEEHARWRAAWAALGSGAEAPAGLGPGLERLFALRQEAVPDAEGLCAADRRLLGWVARGSPGGLGETSRAWGLPAGWLLGRMGALARQGLLRIHGPLWKGRARLSQAGRAQLLALE